MINVYATKINGAKYDVTQLVESIMWMTDIEGQPGSISFQIQSNNTHRFVNGEYVTFYINKKKLFKGRVTSMQATNNSGWQITAKDNMRYLDNEDTLLFPSNTLSDRFVKICKTQGIKHKVLHNSSYKCSKVIKDSHTYYAMLEDAIKETKRGTGKRFAIWDNFGTLELFDVSKKRTTYVVSEKHNVLSVNYQKNIDNMKNSIKVLREDSDGKKREVKSAQDKASIKRWGKMQRVETASNAKMNAAQLQNKANSLLKQENKEETSLTIEIVGNANLRAGNSVVLQLDQIFIKSGIKNNKIGLITSCTQKFSAGNHTTTLEIEV